MEHARMNLHNKVLINAILTRISSQVHFFLSFLFQIVIDNNF